MANYHNLPVVRVNGVPVANAVRPINRSEVVRRIFLSLGRIVNGLVHDCLATQGLEVSDSVINVQRKKLTAAGRI